MGKVDRLRNRVEPFAALLWALGIECTYILTLDPARWPGITPPPYTQSMSLQYMVCLILNKDALPPPPFPI